MDNGDDSSCRRCDLTLLILACSSLALGDDHLEENIDFDRPEAWAMKYFAAVGTMTMAAPSRARGRSRPR
jgi:hypothetical protein